MNRLGRWLAAAGLVTGLNAMALAAPLQPELEALQAYTQAREAIRSGQDDQAEILLERVLMLQPEHAEARIDLALLLAGKAQTDAALALLQSLLDDPRTEAPYAQPLKGLMAQIRRGEQPQTNPYALSSDGLWAGRPPVQGLRPDAVSGLRPVAGAPARPAPWRGEVSLSASTNPMARTSAGFITLTLADGPITLPLASSPHSGLLAGTSLTYNTESHGGEIWVQHANIPGASTAGRAVLWSRLPAPDWLKPAADFANLPPVMGFVQAQRSLDGQQRALLGLSSTLDVNRLSLTRYQESTTQDRGLVMRLDHSKHRWLGANWLASIERSKSTEGVQGYWRTSIGTELPLADDRKILGQWMHHQDTYAYSDLLAQGVQRRLDALYVAYEQQTRLDGEKTLIWRVFRDERRSNLELFAYKDYGIQISLARNWR